MNDARQTFGLTLRTHREQLGITLSDIADNTKISAALLSALERGDLSRWPKGIFRRSFVREYLVAVGLSPEPYLRDFARLFPEESAAAQDGQSDLRLTLVAKDTAASVALKRVAVVVVELAALALVGTASTWLIGVDALSAIGFSALIYYPVVNLCVDRTPGFRAWRTLANAPLPAADADSGRYEEIEAV